MASRRHSQQMNGRRTRATAVSSSGKFALQSKLAPTLTFFTFSGTATCIFVTPLNRGGYPGNRLFSISVAH
eukprot:3712980-Prymnesium_polylepis.1